MDSPNLPQLSDLPDQLLKTLTRGLGPTIPRKDPQLLQARVWTGWWVLSDEWPRTLSQPVSLVLHSSCETLTQRVVKVISFLIRIVKGNRIFLFQPRSRLFLRNLITINPLVQWLNFQLHISSEILIWKLSYQFLQRCNYSCIFLIRLLHFFP